MGQKIQGESTVLEEETPETNEIEQEVETNEPDKEESPEQSTLKALEELRGNKGDGGEGEQTEEASPIEQNQHKPIKDKQAREIEPDLDPDVYAPERLKAHEKELFRKIPQKWVKKFINRTVKELEATTTRQNQEYSAATREASGIINAIKPFVDQFIEREIPVEVGLAELCLTQKRLTNFDDPALQKRTWLDIGRSIGMDVSAFEGGGGVQNGTIPDISAHPVVKELKDKINLLQEKYEPVYSEREQARTQAFEQAYSTTLAELEGVQNEMDAAGNYKFPELHEASFLDSWKPLVSALVRNEKLSYANAARKAYSLMTGKSSSSPNQTRLPAANNQNTRAISAAVSVRGRTAPQTSLRTNGHEIPSNETPEQSTWAALEDLRAGRN